MTGGGLSADGRPPVYKAVGVALAIASGVFIGVSFVLKKKGLLAANLKDGKEAGEGYGYLKNAWWWTGMILMIIGEVCNFCAYAFVEAILVTPLGALSVVITAILSSIFLKERLSFVGKIGCFMCIVGSIVIVINAPSQTSVSTIQDMKKFVVSPGFLSYAGVVIVGCAAIVIWVAPKYGDKSMMVYITVCSLIGGLSVVATQGLGAAVVSQASGIPQFNQWFLYVLLVFVVVTLLVEIIYLNKALNIYNAALVTPTYYVFFTSATMVTSAILFRGFKGSPSAIATVVMGFLQICAGVVLLQLSKSAKDVPDTEIFRGELDQVKLVAEQSEPESEPKADTIRGTAAIIRQISVARRKAEEEEAWRIHDERARDMHSLYPPGENVEWDGVRRRVTFSSNDKSFAGRRRNTLSGQHPPRFATPVADINEDPEVTDGGGRRRSMSVDEAMRRKAYPDIESQLKADVPEHIEHADGDTFLGRVRNLFVTKQRSRTSLRNNEIELPMSIAHRDLRDATPPTSPLRGQRPRLNTIASPDARSPYEPYAQQSASQSSPHVHVHFQELPEPTNSHQYDAGSHRTGEYAPVPTNLSESYFSGSSSRHNAKRQFSFQTILHRPKTSPGPEHHQGHSPRPALWKTPSSTVSQGSGGSHQSRTEEEMLGLVVGDAAITESKTPSEDDEKGSIRMVKDDDSADESRDYRGKRWNEKATWER